MPKPYETTSGGRFGGRDRAWAVARATAGIAAGGIAGWIARDVGVGATVAAATVSVLREIFVRPRR